MPLSSSSHEAMQSAAANVVRPVERLDIKPKIRSVEDAELALHELAWCEAVQAAVRAKAEELLQEINEAASKAASFEVGEELVPVADRRELLAAELLRWGDRNRATLCPGRKKSVEFRNGRLRWRDGKDAVDYVEGASQKTAVEAVGHESGLLAKIEKLVDGIGWHGVFQAKLTVNKTNAVKARQKQQLSDEQLAEVGLEFKPGEEYIAVETADFIRQGQ